MNSLKRSLTFNDILMLAFSTMIGWGWVSLAGSWSASGGMAGASIAFVLGAVLCIFVGLTYCELISIFPYAGGEIVFSYNAIGYHAAWLTGWMTAFAYVGVAAWEGAALATAIDYLVEIPRKGYLFTVAGFEVYFSWLIIPAVTGSVLIFINFRGIKVSAVFQKVVTILLILGGMIFAAVGTLKGDIANAMPLITDTKGVFMVVLAVPAMFVGFDVIPQTTEEMDLPIRKIPGAIIISICLAALWYILMIITASFAAPASVLTGEGLSVINAVNYVTLYPLVGKLIIISAIMGILSSWNGFLIGATRVLYAMGKYNMLPSFFGSLHKKYNTPLFATLFVGAITIFTPVLGRNSLQWFVRASSFGTVITYFMVALSFVVMRYRFPDRERPFKLRHGLFIGYMAIVISLFFIVLYLPFGSSSLTGTEWTIVAAWVFIGVILYTCSMGRHN